MLDRLRTRLDAGRQDGFTLIELLIVIVILGILAGIVVFAVGGISDRGDRSACKSDYKAVEVAQEAHRAQRGGYAGSTADLVTAGFLRSAPPSAFPTGSTNKYAINTSAATGGPVTVTLRSAPTAPGAVTLCDTIA